MDHKVMRCKLKLNHLVLNDAKTVGQVRFGAVWEGSTEKQQASENAVFGQWTPFGEFNATIMNPDVLAALEVGAEYYLDFIKKQIDSGVVAVGSSLGS